VTSLLLITAVTWADDRDIESRSIGVEVEASRQVAFAAVDKDSTRFHFFEEDGVDVWAMGLSALSAVGLFAGESGLDGVERLRAGNDLEPVFATSGTR
jgi:hypothetical protein